MYVCHTLVTISVHSLWIICTSLCSFHISVHLCVFRACWVTPGPSMLLPMPCFGSQGPKGIFLPGYADKLKLPGWLTAPAVAGSGHKRTLNTKLWPWALFYVFVSLIQTLWHHCANSECQMGPAWGKKPKIRPKIWIQKLILNSGGSDLTWSGYLPLLHSSLPSLVLPLSRFLSA